ncbi:MAG: hypothetical protein Q8N55_04710 [bacterium]|nr:hypothetical protein [bacterium]
MSQDLIASGEDYIIFNPRYLVNVCSKEKAELIANWLGENGAFSKKIFNQMLGGSALALLAFEEGKEELQAIALWQISIEDDEKTLFVDLCVSDEFSEAYQEHLREILTLALRRQFGMVCQVMIFCAKKKKAG